MKALLAGLLAVMPLFASVSAYAAPLSDQVVSQPSEDDKDKDKGEKKSD